MTLFVPYYSTTVATGPNPYNLASGDALYVGTGIQVAQLNTVVVIGDAGSQIIVDGTLAGLNPVSTAGEIEIGATGTVQGFPFAIATYAATGVLNNYGHIIGGAVAVNEQTGAFQTFYNAGLIES